jgi:iron complex transport system ATP-binding protein
MILMDEPTAHLDYKNELLFLETTVSLCREEGITVLMATHSPDQAFYFASKGLPVHAVMIAGGRLVCAGAPDDVITTDVIREVYGVRARILTDRDENGQTIKKISLLETA